MNARLIVGLLFLGGTLFYLPTLYALMKMEFKIKGFRINSLKGESVDLSILLQLLNLSKIDVNLQKFDFDVKFQNIIIGKINSELNINLIQSVPQQIELRFIVEKKETTNLLFNSILNGNFKTKNIEISGYITANEKLFPYSTSFNISDYL